MAHIINLRNRNCNLKKSSVTSQRRRKEEGKMADQATSALPESFPMVGGEGDHSYVKNSSYQRMILDAAKEMIYESIIDKLDMDSLGFDGSSSGNTFNLADFGSSVGPNTFLAMQNIIEAVGEKCQRNSEALEFQVFFNDHSDNDFNTLFRNLPPSRKYFAAGVPGSFYGRLFPKSTLHFAHSSTALHWLSKIPKEITDPKSPAWDKDKIFCTGLVKQVTEAYSGQFNDDMESFLNARAQELVPGGWMLIVACTKPDGVRMIDTSSGRLYDFLGSCLTDMARMGIIDGEKVDSFNLPLYYPSSEELKGAIERNGCFSIERMVKLPDPPTSNWNLTPQSVMSGIRAAFEGVFKEHFGGEFVDKIFNYFATNYADNFPELSKHISHNSTDSSLVLLKRVI